MDNDVVKRKIEKYIIYLSVTNETSKTKLDFKKLQGYCDKLNNISHPTPIWIVK
jgi:hypothetical protein